MRSVTLGDQLIRLGDEEVIVAGGMESMSNAPYYLPKGRFGLKMGDAPLVDGMIYDGFPVRSPRTASIWGHTATQRQKNFH